ncbi:MAG: FHA domain-containing protein [Planctomycetes bacterium]|nr:FHA domain-containing protein [Planctomycetota bacterium]
MECTSTFEDFTRAHGALDLPGFLASFGHPFLLVNLSGPRVKQTDFATRAPERGFDGITGPEPDRAPGSGFWVLGLLRSARNRVPDAITLGRAPDNDLVIPRYSIVDAGSSFGTTVNGNSVTTASPHPLASGDTIVFARVVPSHFFLPKDFFEYIHLARRVEKGRKRTP